ncbi:MAG: alpha/beta hydrolase [Patescibacteria group bacterium]|nr:alpha/beta hydrolase [Patescibacteria group bacterium]
MKRVIIVHGYTGYPDKNWFPWLKSELEKLGVKVYVPAMPNTDAPQLIEWLPYLQQEVGLPTTETYLVGHSLGCPTILRYLESLTENEQVGGALLVAGFAEPLPNLPELNSFTENYWSDEKVKAHTKQLAIINSDDDPAVPLINGEHVRDRFDAELILVQNAGHINEKSGYFQVPFVLDKLKRMMSI